MHQTSAPNLDWRFKALPGAGHAVPVDEIGSKGWNILDQDVMLPAAVLNETALFHNRDWMKRFVHAAGVKLCPHGKTSMSPELLAMQLADGAWGITAATVAHVRTYRHFGIDRILFANQLIGRQNISFVLDELESDNNFDFYCLVDSISAIEHLETPAAERNLKRPLQVLLELGMPGGRTGVRTDAEALRLASRIESSPWLALRGIEAFEGIAQGEADGEPAMASLIDRVRLVAEACDRQKLFSGVPILSAGGSSFFDVAASTLSGAAMTDRFEVILRSGCYLVHDSDFYRELIDRLIARGGGAVPAGEGLRPALELWACVHSRPEANRVIVGLGKRDASFDVAFPRPVKWARTRAQGSLPLDGHRTVRLDDQHAYLDVPSDSPLQVGDLVCFGISHPCTTFDRWPALFMVDEGLTITGAVTTCF